MARKKKATLKMKGRRPANVGVVGGVGLLKGLTAIGMVKKAMDKRLERSFKKKQKKVEKKARANYKYSTAGLNAWVRDYLKGDEPSRRKK